ncbi:hypothetical protein FRC01_014618 [Tulasnella sp. 417]|nr:hypothetical protein FRC01_014618 [Tulasnella sp. 417]
MKHFLLSQLEMCCSAASYYDMLALQTDGVGTRFLKFLSSTREWKVIKTFIKANSKTGLDLKPGEGTVECGFCPIPGVNIPEMELLYTVFEAFDGNFSLQLNNKGVSEVVDPSIIGDAGYWVRQTDGIQYLAALADEGLGAASLGNDNTSSPCQHIRAGNVSLNAKTANKLVRGIVLGSCGRHNFSRPNAAMDLILGERYSNTDCCLLSVLKTAQGLDTVFVTYDIWCKYSINLEKRLAAGGAPSFSDLGLTVLGGIPKFHIGGHDQRLQREIIRARRQILQRREDLQDLEESLQPSLVKEFQDWDREHPEIEKYCTPSRAEILRRLYAKEIENELGPGGLQNQNQQSEPATSAALFISTAIDLEAQGLRLKEKALLASEGGNKEAVSDWITAENRFKSSLSRHYSQLAAFAPPLSGFDFTLPPGKLLHTAKLYLPSQFSKDDRELYKLEKLSDLESSIRIPLAQEEIIRLRDALGVKAFLIREGRQTGKSGLTGTASLTRSQSRLQQAQIRINQIASRYKHHFDALRELGTSLGIGTEAGALQELTDSDLGITSTWTEQDINFSRGGRRPTVGASFTAVPWIWKCFGPGLVSKEDTEDVVAQKIDQFNRQAMRVEWLTSRAFLHRWVEEEKLLREEARRIVAYFQWKEKQLASQLGHEEGEISGYKSWLERRRRMWQRMASQAESLRARTEDMIAAGKW